MNCFRALQMLLAGEDSAISFRKVSGHFSLWPHYQTLLLYTISALLALPDIVDSGCRLASRSLGSQFIREESHLLLCCFGYVAMSYKDFWQLALYFIQSLFPRALAQCPRATSLDTQSNTSLCIWNDQLLTLTYYPWPELVQ